MRGVISEFPHLEIFIDTVELHEVWRFLKAFHRGTVVQDDHPLRCLLAIVSLVRIFCDDRCFAARSKVGDVGGQRGLGQATPAPKKADMDLDIDKVCLFFTNITRLCCKFMKLKRILSFSGVRSAGRDR